MFCDVVLDRTTVWVSKKFKATLDKRKKANGHSNYDSFLRNLLNESDQFRLLVRLLNEGWRPAAVYHGSIERIMEGMVKEMKGYDGVMKHEDSMAE